VERAAQELNVPIIVGVGEEDLDRMEEPMIRESTLRVIDFDGPPNAS
jgi:hypothetical protein